MVQVQFGEIWNFQRNGTLSARWFFEIRQRRRKKFEKSNQSLEISEGKRSAHKIVLSAFLLSSKAWGPYLKVDWLRSLYANEGEK